MDNGDALEEDKKFHSFRGYARHIFESSLITSLPEIVTAKNWILRIIKLVVLLLCFAGFVHQTREFLMVYRKYPTNVNVEVSFPYEVPMPAITVCSRNRFNRTAYCIKNPERCDETTHLEICPLQGFGTRYCSDSSEHKFYKMPKETIFENLSYSQWDDLRMYRHTNVSISKCMLKKSGISEACSDVRESILMPYIYDEAPMYCDTLFSLQGLPDKKEDFYPNSFKITLLLHSFPHDYSVRTFPITNQVALHDRRGYLNPFTDGYLVKGGIKYEVTVSMSENELLSAPYETNCTDYVELWRKNGGKGPINQVACIEYCKLTNLLKRGECVDRSIDYPHENKLCPPNKAHVTSEMTRSCAAQCGQACKEKSYEMHFSEVGNHEAQCQSLWCKLSYIHIQFNFDRLKLTKFKHHPKFESVEMFSYIGGYMGMWIGLSLVSMFDFFENIADLFYFPIGKRKWQENKNRIRRMKKNVNEIRQRRYY